MGCDIHGIVEYKENNIWKTKYNVGNEVGRNYDIFGCLFGVRNNCGFNPIAEGRGLPEDMNEELKTKAHDSDYHSHTYINLEEIENINWDEEGETEDSRIHQYERKNGKLEMCCKFGRSRRLDGHMEELNEKGEIELDGFIFKLEKVKRKDALSGAWKELIENMKKLGQTYGKENVRMIVWFDC